MNKRELLKALHGLGVRDDAYDLNGGHETETYTLAKINGKWIVYYSERGLESGREEFDTEDLACDYLLHKLMNDPTTQK